MKNGRVAHVTTTSDRSLAIATCSYFRLTSVSHDAIGKIVV